MKKPKPDKPPCIHADWQAFQDSLDVQGKVLIFCKTCGEIGHMEGGKPVWGQK